MKNKKEKKEKNYNIDCNLENLDYENYLKERNHYLEKFYKKEAKESLENKKDKGVDYLYHGPRFAVPNGYSHN